MPVEGLNNIYGIPPVKKERDAGQEEGKKRSAIRDRKKSRKRKDEKGQEGRIDIRV
jgi:hypothetical protein